MDLIYTDENREDLGVLFDYSFDLAFGEDENDFELKVSTNNYCCKAGYWLYIEGTEYGGIIDNIEVDTGARRASYKGRTFHGILESKIIRPDVGEDYYIVSGEANALLQTLIGRLGLGELFIASAENSGITINRYQFYRYVEGYTGIRKMLASVDAKLKIELIDGKVRLSAVPIGVYEDEELDSDHVNFEIEKNFNAVNHLVCLGMGELKDRVVIDLYADAAGNVSYTPTFTGIRERAKTFDYPNAESEEDLIKYGTEKLKEEFLNDTVRINLDNTYSFDIGDKITVSDIVTEITLTKAISKKIVTINKDYFSVNYKVGE